MANPWDDPYDDPYNDPPSQGTPSWESLYPDAFRRQGIESFYQQFLGRGYDPEGFQAHYNSPYGLGMADNPVPNTVAYTMWNSPEAQAYRGRPGAQKTGGDAGDWQEYFWSLVSGVDPRTQNLADIVFPKFREQFPNARLDRGDIDPYGTGEWWDVLEAAGAGGKNWQMVAPGSGGGAGGGEYSDPLTAQYEQLLQSQIALYQQQQRDMQAQESRRQAARTQTQARAGDLTKYVEERIGKLKGPAYTGQEADILRTQLMDPLEQDRTAAMQRSLQNVGSRGFDPSSGIAQELFQHVNQAFDEERSRRQGGLAEAQIREQRSREQEAQELMQYLTQLPLAVETGDINYLNLLQQAVNQPGQNAVSASSILAGLGGQRLQEALATLGVGQGQNPTGGLLALLDQYSRNRNSNQNNWSNYWGSIGGSFF